jgi:hypothetical protein
VITRRENERQMQSIWEARIAAAPDEAFKEVMRKMQSRQRGKLQ